MTMAKRLAYFLLGINAIPFLFNADDTLSIVVFGLMALFIPAFVMDALSQKSGQGGKQ